MHLPNSIGCPYVGPESTKIPLIQKVGERNNYFIHKCINYNEGSRVKMKTTAHLAGCKQEETIPWEAV